MTKPVPMPFQLARALGRTGSSFEPQYLLSTFTANPVGQMVKNMMSNHQALKHRQRILQLSTIGLLLLIQLGFACEKVAAQAAMRESLERIDTNQNGRIDPDEVTPITRPFLSRIERATRVEIEDSDSIERWLLAIEEYYEDQRNDWRRDNDSDNNETVRSFDLDENQFVIPEFGVGEVRFPFTQQDLGYADWVIRRYDENQDRSIDRRESREARWVELGDFPTDFDKDRKLNRLELAQHFARGRESSADENILRERRNAAMYNRRDDSSESYRRDRSRDWSRRGGIDFWLTSNLIERFDENRNGRLEANEHASLQMPISQIDINRDTTIDREELFAYLYEQQEQAKQYEEGIPGWFYEKDSNQDDQIQMSEFAKSDEWSDEKIAEFEKLDLNGDGLLTTAEITNSIANVGGTYESQDAELIPPQKTIVSEIEVPDNFRIRDLDVQISITHSYTGHLDGYLTGPDGQRIELFTEVGGSDDHFENTIFDDDSGNRIDKARPPFADRYKPEGAMRGDNGLSKFDGKDAQGVWQLVIRATRSERFGMLHSWKLQFETIED